MARHLLTAGNQNSGALELVEPEEGDEVGSRFDELVASRQQRFGRLAQSQTNQLRARQQLITEELAQERFKIQGATLELNRTKALMEVQKQRAALQLQATIQQHTVNALDKLGKLDPGSSDYNIKLAEAIHDNPLATRDPIVKDLISAQIHSRHVQEQAASEIQVNEEKQASEYEARHGIEVPMNDKTGRRDFGAADSARIIRDREVQSNAVGQVDKSLLPSETTIVDGKVTQRFKAPAPEKPPAPDVVTTVTKPSEAVGGPASVTTTTRHVVPAVTPAGTPKVKPPLSGLIPLD